MLTLFRKANDKGFDKLLRSHVRGLRAPNAPCEEFDPNLATAYIEHNLTVVERTHFEGHLSGCTSCRTSVVALARLATADLSTETTREAHLVDARSRSFGSTITGFLGLTNPRLALAAAALVVLVFSLPVIFWQNQSIEESSARRATFSDAERAVPPASQPTDAEGVARLEEPAASQAASARQTQTSFKAPAEGDQQRQNEQFAQKQELTEHESDKVATVTTVSETAGAKKVDDLSAARTETIGTAPPAVQPTAGAAGAERQENSRKEKALPYISKDEASRLPSEDKNQTTLTKLKPGRVDVSRTEREKVATIRPSDTDAPKTDAPDSESSGSRTLTRAQGSRALVDNTTAARSERSRVGARERKVGKKTFWLANDTWTDKDYEPGKQLPVITVIRDSDVYKEMIEKNNKLKTFLTAFKESERAVIVFKNTVYKLLPQGGNR